MVTYKLVIHFGRDFSSDVAGEIDTGHSYIELITTDEPVAEWGARA